MTSKPTNLTLAIALAIASTSAVMMTGCAGDRYHQSTGEYIDDHSIQMRVRGALNDNPDYKFDRVTVTVYKRNVQLSGFVDMSAQKRKALEIAKGVDGVSNVSNGITVKDASEQSNGQAMDDKELRAKVESALSSSPDYKLDGVKVSAATGTIQLSGFVNTSVLKDKAAEIAKEVGGVKSVVNNIEVKDDLK